MKKSWHKVFEHWNEFAVTYAPSIGVAPAIALKAHAMVCSALGATWLDDQEAQVRLPSRTISDTHPLFRTMCGGTELCVVGLLELAAYLISFRNDAQLGSVIAALKDAAKYESAVQELAFAWKFRNAGATIRLGPQTPTGVADFAASVDRRDHIVEVSGFPADPFRSDLMAFTGAMQSAIKAGRRKARLSAPIAVELELSSEATIDLRKLRGPMHAQVISSIRAATTNELQAEASLYFGALRVRPVGPHEVPDLNRWSIAACLSLVPRTELGQIGKGIDYRNGKDTDWMYIRVPDGGRDPYKKIRAKLKIESRQLRGCTDGVIVVLVHGLLVGTPRDNDPQLRTLIDEFSRNHTSTTGIAIGTMPRKADGTAGVAGAYFALGPNSLAKSFWRRLESADQTRSVLCELNALA